MKFSKKFFTLLFSMIFLCMSFIPTSAQNLLTATTSNTLTCLGMIGEMNRKIINREMVRDGSQMNSSQKITNSVLTEEEVFEALAYTYDDESLRKKITFLNKEISNCRKIYAFDSLAYSEFTNGQYGGLYVDENSNLVICYTDGEMYNRMTELNALKSNRLSISQNNTISYRVEIKKVAYSYKELKSYCDKIASIASEYSDISSWGIDNKKNRVYVSLYETDTSFETRSALVSIFGEDILIFNFISPKDKIHNIANIENTINGTSDIGTMFVQTTPAGIAYNFTRNENMVVTCAHGYSLNEKIYTNFKEIGNSVYANEIGTIVGLVNNSTADFSVIELNEFSEYRGTAVDEILGGTPVVGTTITLRGSVSGTVYAKVLDTAASFDMDGITYSDHIKVDYEMKRGDSGGGAILRTIDMGRTNIICAINRAAGEGATYLVKGRQIAEYCLYLP